MGRTLLSLFGHKNSRDGILSDIAVRRCAAAAELLRRTPEADLLVTAGYPRHANGSDRPHWQLLADELVAQGVPRERILVGPTSATTIDEALRTRKVAVDGGYSRVIGVTSDFHAARVTFLLRRVLVDFEVDVVATPDGPAFTQEDRRAEAFSADYLSTTWVLPPLYRRDAPFPHGMYQAGVQERRRAERCAQLALVAAPLLLLLAAGAWIVDDPFVVGAALVACALAAAALVPTWRTALQLARRARMFLRATEVGFDADGFLAGLDISDLHRHMLPAERAAPLVAWGVAAGFALLALRWLALVLG